MKKHLSLMLALAGCVLATAGCERQASTPPGVGSVAVVDIDKVAKGMGWIDDLQKSKQANEAELSGQLEEIVRTRAQAIKNKKASLAAEAKLTAEQLKVFDAAKTVQDLDALPFSKDQKQQFAELVARANNDIYNARVNANQAIQVRMSALITTYRDRIRPVAGRVARRQGMSVVLVVPADNILEYDAKSADISDMVIDELQRIPAASQPSN